MKKTIIFVTAVLMSAVSCRSESSSTVTEVDIETQNTLDDQAIQYYMETHYLNDLGIVKEFSSTDTSDDHYSKLSELNPQKLNNGTYYIIRSGAQPVSGTDIASDSVLRIMDSSMTYLASSTDNGGRFSEGNYFSYGLISGNITVDPMYFYVTQNRINTYNTTNSTSYGKDFFEIEGFSEALQKFKAFDKSDSELYNLQGVIIIPSRAAFARDAHYNYTGSSLRNRSFVFNFQVYKSSPRS